MSIVIGQELGPILCEAWGLNPDQVTKIDISIHPDCAVVADIEMRVGDELEPILRTYYLAETGSSDVDNP